MEAPLHSFLIPTSLFWVHPSAGDWWFGFCSLWRCLKNYGQAMHDNNIKATGLMLLWPTSFKVFHCLVYTMANVCYWSNGWVGKSRIIVQWVFKHKRRRERAEKEGRRKIWDKKGPWEILNMSCHSLRGCNCYGLQAAAYLGHIHASIKQKYSG